MSSGVREYMLHTSAGRLMALLDAACWFANNTCTFQLGNRRSRQWETRCSPMFTSAMCVKMFDQSKSNSSSGMSWNLVSFCILLEQSWWLSFNPSLIHRLHLCRGVKLPKKCPGYNTKQSDGEVPLLLKLWGMRCTPSLPSLPGQLWFRVVAPDWVLSMG